MSEKFRYQLRNEVEQWQAEGIIDRNLYEQLAHRYQFDELETTGRNRFIFILLGLGSILLGLAVITFVAANWQIWSRALKVAVLLGLLIAVNTAGFYLWRSSARGWQSRLGQALLLLGGLILGANLALMSQMFHLSGGVERLYLVWGVGVLAMAYGLRLTSLAILSIILISIGYCAGIPGFQPEFSVYPLAQQHMPLLVCVLFVPLAYWCSSRWLFGLGAFLASFALEINITRSLPGLGISTVAGSTLAAVAWMLPPAMLWPYRDSLWGLATMFFDPVAQSLAIFFLGAVLYGCSFHFYWQNDAALVAQNLSLFNGLILLDLLVFSGIALFAWWRLGYSRTSRPGWRLDASSSGIAILLILVALLFGLHLSLGPLGAIGTFSFNALLAVLGIGLVRQALASGTRRGFWSGIFLLTLQLISRMLEYSTGLLLKAIILFCCGIAIIAAGLWFERYVRRFKTNQE